MRVTYLAVENETLAAIMYQKELIRAYSEVFYYESSLQGIPRVAYEDTDIEKKIKQLMKAVPIFIPAIKDQKVVGVLAVRPGDPREIQTLFVEEEYRNQGIGQKLVEAFQSIAERLPLKVECMRNNVNALRFYERLGFEFEDKARYPSNLVGYRKVKF